MGPIHFSMEVKVIFQNILFCVEQKTIHLYRLGIMTIFTQMLTDLRENWKAQNFNRNEGFQSVKF